MDLADYSTWRSQFGNTVFPDSGADGNANGIIDASDYVVWAHAYHLSHSTSIGDFNGDGVVGVADYNLYMSNDMRADANGDSFVNSADYSIWYDTFGSIVGDDKFGLLNAAFGPGLPPEVVGMAR